MAEEPKPYPHEHLTSFLSRYTAWLFEETKQRMLRENDMLAKTEDPLDQIDREMYEAVKWEHLFLPAAVVMTADEWRDIAQRFWKNGPIPMPNGKRSYRGVDVLIVADRPEQRVLLAPRVLP
jgi:hypothetical protein